MNYIKTCNGHVSGEWDVITIVEDPKAYFYTTFMNIQDYSKIVVKKLIASTSVCMS